jgi:riboflavin synthase
LYFDVIPETLKVTNLGQLSIGSEVNLESSLTLADYIDGHLVSGHVDFMTEVIEINELKEYYFELPMDYARFVALKGSIALNGVSLTISGLTHNSFRVSLIPATLAETNLKNLKIGDKVNVEIDVVARYLDRLKNF